MLISGVMPNLSLDGLRQLEQRFSVFLEAVSQKATQSDVTWQAILRAFLFQPEAQRISAYLNEYDNELAAEKKRAK